MKKLIIVFTCFMLILSLAACTENTYVIYTAAEQTENLTVFEDSAGNLWAAYTEIPEGARCLLIMDNRGTAEITDDIITKIIPLEGGKSHDYEISQNQKYPA